MSNQPTSEPPPTVIQTAQGAWCCPVCGGFVRKDALFCKHCKREFASGAFDHEWHPSIGRVLATLIAAGGIPLLFVFGGMSLGLYFWPGNDNEMLMFGPPSMWVGGACGMVWGVGIAFIIMIVGLRSK
jgi:hypothetical protein